MTDIFSEGTISIKSTLPILEPNNCIRTLSTRGFHRYY